MFSSIGLLTVFLFTGDGLSRIEGAILMSLYIAYIYWLLSHRDEILEEELSGGEQVERKWTAPPLPMVSWSPPVCCWPSSQHTIWSTLPATWRTPSTSPMPSSVPPCPASERRFPNSPSPSWPPSAAKASPLAPSSVPTSPTRSFPLASLLLFTAGVDEASFALTAYVIIPATFVGTGVALLMMRSEYEFKRWEGVVLIFIYVLFLQRSQQNGLATCPLRPPAKRLI